MSLSVLRTTSFPARTLSDVYLTGGAISSASEVDFELAARFPAEHTEILRIVDHIQVTLRETKTFFSNLLQHAPPIVYRGKAVVITAQGGSDFFREHLYLANADPSYGWASCIPDLQQGPILDGGHISAFTTHDNLKRVAAVLDAIIGDQHPTSLV